MGYAGSDGGSLDRSSVDLNVITCGYLHEKARAGAGVNFHIRYRYPRKLLWGCKASLPGS